MTVLGLGGLISLGLLSGGPALLLRAIILTFLLFGSRAGVVAFLVSMIVMLAVYGLFASGAIVLQIEPSDYIASLSTWITRLAAIALVAAMVGFSISSFHRMLAGALNRERHERATPDGLVQSAPAGILFLDQNGAIQRSNRRIELLFGYA